MWQKTGIRFLVRCILVVLWCCLIIQCENRAKIEETNENQKQTPRVLKIDPNKRFSGWSVVKEFGIQRRYLRWIFPIKDRYLGQQVMESSEREYKLFVVDKSGKEIKHVIIARGQGPEEIMGLIPETLTLSKDERRVSFYDGGYYLKSLDIESFKIHTINKIDTIIKRYGSHYYIGRHGTTSFETKGNLVVTSFESSGFFSDHVYDLVMYHGPFDKFQIIASLKKGIPKWLKESHNSKNRIITIDYYDRLRYARLFSVDWKREMIYVIPDIETPEIERIEFGGRKTMICLDINSKTYLINRSAFNLYFAWYNDNQNPILKKTLDFEFRLLPHAPALQGIKVIGDWLLIITGNRDWDRNENEVLVFLIPSLEYQGSFPIPFPNPPDLSIKWGDGYFSMHNIIEHEDDYLSHHQIFRYKIR